MDDSSTSNDTMMAIPFIKPTKESTKVQSLLQPREWSMATFSDDEVLIKVEAFGLNFADVIARKGYYDDAPPFPFVPGYECSGTIAGVGKDVPEDAGLVIGQRVLALTPFGGYAEYARAPYLGVVPLPDTMSFAEGASIPVIFATAYHSIFHTGLVMPGDRVLVHAAAGGLGLAAVQLLKHSGCEVFGTASKPEKLRLLKEDFGCDHVINYREGDFVKEIHRIVGTKEPCIDLVLDAVGGAQFKKDISLLRPGGRVVGLGAAGFVNRTWSKSLGLLPGLVSMITLSSIDLMMSCSSFVGVNMKRLSDQKPHVTRKALVAVMDLFAEGSLRTCLLHEDSVQPWTELGRVQEEMEARKTSGKMVFLVQREEVEGESKEDEEVEGESKEAEEEGEVKDDVDSNED